MVRFVWKADEGEAESIVLFFGGTLIVDAWALNAESLIQDQLKSHSFPGGILAEAISMTHSGMLYRLDISTFYFHELLPFQIFVTSKFVKA